MQKIDISVKLQIVKYLLKVISSKQQKNPGENSQALGRIHLI